MAKPEETKKPELPTIETQSELANETLPKPEEELVEVSDSAWKAARYQVVNSKLGDWDQGTILTASEITRKSGDIDRLLLRGALRPVE